MSDGVGRPRPSVHWRVRPKACQWKDNYQEKEINEEVKENLHTEKVKDEKSLNAKQVNELSDNLGGDQCSLPPRRSQSMNRQGTSHTGAGTEHASLGAGEQTPM